MRRTWLKRKGVVVDVVVVETTHNHNNMETDCLVEKARRKEQKWEREREDEWGFVCFCLVLDRNATEPVSARRTVPKKSL